MRAIFVLALALGLGGCATVMRGTSEQIAFDTVPSGAEVRVTVHTGYLPPEGPEAAPPDPELACVSPCSLQVKRHEKLTVSISKPGFETERFALNPEATGEGIMGSVAGNIIAGGLLGAAVDSASGAMMDHCPNPVRLSLRPVPPPVRGRALPERGPTFDLAAACNAQNAAKLREALASQPLRGN